jgi:hypothetical protein
MTKDFAQLETSMRGDQPGRRDLYRPATCDSRYIHVITASGIPKNGSAFHSQVFGHQLESAVNQTCKSLIAMSHGTLLLRVSVFVIAALLCAAPTHALRDDLRDGEAVAIHASDAMNFEEDSIANLALHVAPFIDESSFSTDFEDDNLLSDAEIDDLANDLLSHHSATVDAQLKDTLNSETEFIPLIVGAVMAAKHIHTAYKAYKVIRAATTAYKAYRASKVATTAVRAYNAYGAVNTAGDAISCSRGNGKDCAKTAAELLLKGHAAKVYGAYGVATDVVDATKFAAKVVASAIKSPTSGKTSLPAKTSLSVPASGKTSLPAKTSLSVPASGKTSLPAKTSLSVPASGKTSLPAKTSLSVPASGKTSLPAKTSLSVPASGKTSLPAKTSRSTPASGKTGVPAKTSRSTPASGKGSQKPNPTRSASSAPVRSAPSSSKSPSGRRNFDNGAEISDLAKEKESLRDKVEAAKVMKIIATEVKNFESIRDKPQPLGDTAESSDERAAFLVMSKIAEDYEKVASKVQSLDKSAKSFDDFAVSAVSKVMSAVTNDVKEFTSIRSTFSHPRKSGRVVGRARPVRRRAPVTKGKSGVYLKVVINALEQANYDAEDFDSEKIYGDLD